MEYLWINRGFSPKALYTATPDSHSTFCPLAPNGSGTRAALVGQFAHAGAARVARIAEICYTYVIANDESA